MVAQHVVVTGRNMDVGDALSAHIRTRMEALSQKYFGLLVTCSVILTKNHKGIAHRCDASVTVGQAMYYVGHAEHNDPRQCFEMTLEHVAKQLRRDKRKLHETKPNGHMKERILNELSVPDPEAPMIAGDELSILEPGEDPAEAVARLYQE